MAEPIFLLAAIGAIFASTRGAWFAAGLLGGTACIIKPYGIFVGLGLAWAALMCPPTSLRLSTTLRLAGGAIFPIGLVALLNLVRLGQVAPQFHVYSASLEQLNVPQVTARLLGNPSGHWDWPLKALLLTPLRVATPAWKIVYVYAHALAALWLCARAILRRRLHNAPWERTCLVWLVGNTVASFSAGPYWGFHAFDRYVVWAWPAAAALNLDLLKLKLLPILLPLSFAAAAFAMLAR